MGASAVLAGVSSALRSSALSGMPFTVTLTAGGAQARSSGALTIVCIGASARGSSRAAASSAGCVGGRATKGGVCKTPQCHRGHADCLPQERFRSERQQEDNPRKGPGRPKLHTSLATQRCGAMKPFYTSCQGSSEQPSPGGRKHHLHLRLCSLGIAMLLRGVQLCLRESRSQRCSDSGCSGRLSSWGRLWGSILSRLAPQLPDSSRLVSSRRHCSLQDTAHPCLKDQIALS